MTPQPAPRPVSRALSTLALVVALVVVTAIVGACAGSNRLTGPTWQLGSVTETVPAFQGVVPAADQSRYTITFMDDGTASIKADCNNVAATYETSGKQIRIVPGPSTLVACPDDTIPNFVTWLSGATSYNVGPSGLTLYILNEGRLEFTAAP